MRLILAINNPGVNCLQVAQTNYKRSTNKIKMTLPNINMH